MANRQQIQFTDENYVTLEEVRSLLGSVATDSLWPEIVAYRSKSKRLLDINNISNYPYFLTLTEAIKGKIEITENKIKKLYGLISGYKKEANALDRTLLLPSLMTISSLEKCDMPELSIKALFNGTYSENAESHYPVIAYKKTINHFISTPFKVPDDIFLAEAYEWLLGHDVLTFYRYEDFDETFSQNRFLYMKNKTYSYAPCHLLDPFTVSLYDFAQNSEFSPLTRALSSLILIYQFKPFMDHNASLASLFAKDVLGYENSDHSAFYIPFELCLVENRKMEVALGYSQKEGDLTYAVLAMNEILGREIDKAIKAINELKISAYSKEYRPSQEEVRSIESLSLFDEEPEPLVQAPLPKVEEAAPTPAPIREEPPKKEEPMQSSFFFIPHWDTIEEEGKRKEAEAKAKEPVIAEPKVEETPVEPVAPIPAKQEEPRPAKEEKVKEEPKEIPSHSVSLPDAPLSASEIKEYAQYLIETNPNLSRKQAVFLANHCTMGRYYTVQDFKKSMKVVYETARTSMEKLANEGYYVKAQVKNKFVYTPRKKEE